MSPSKLALLVLGAVLIPGLSQAGTITTLTLDNCDDMGCDGASLSLSIEDVGGGMYIAEYTVTTDGTQSRLGMNQVGFLAVSGWTDAELIGAPNDLSNWSDVYESTISANSSCSHTNGGTDKICVYGFVDMSTPGDYTWRFKITGGSIIEDQAGWHFSGQWADAAGRTPGKVISAGLPAAGIPEPSAAAVFALGALLVSRRLNRA
jgi:hypothetical protein